MTINRVVFPSHYFPFLGCVRQSVWRIKYVSMQIVKWNQCEIRKFLKGSQRPTNKQINSSTSFLIRTNRKHTKCKCFLKYLNRYRFLHILFVRVLRNRIFSHTHQRLCGLFANVSARATGQSHNLSQIEMENYMRQKICRVNSHR